MKFIRMLQQYLRSRSDLGLWNAVAARVMAPNSPFEPASARKPQLWFLFFSIVLVCGHHRLCLLQPLELRQQETNPCCVSSRPSRSSPR